MKYFFIAIMIYMNVHIVNAQNYIMECSTECNSDTSYSNHVKNAINSSKDKYYDFYNSNLSMWIPQNESELKTIKINWYRRLDRPS